MGATRWVGTTGAIAAMVMSACGPSRAVALREQVMAAQRAAANVTLPAAAPDAVLSGEAIVAANGALAYLRTQVLGEEAAKGCAYSPRGLDLAVWRAQVPGQWIVRIVQRADRCGRPGDANLRDYDWWEVYRVSGDGVVLARASRPDGAAAWSEDAGMREPGEAESGSKDAGGLTPAERGPFFVPGVETAALPDAGAQWNPDAGAPEFVRCGDVTS